MRTRELVPSSARRVGGGPIDTSAGADDRDAGRAADAVASFDAFVAAFDLPLRQALVSIVGIEAARDAAANAFLYAWRHWERIEPMANPRGYVYQAARHYALRDRRPEHVLPSVELLATRAAGGSVPDIEPGLVAALATLSEQQRTVVYLVEGCGMGLTEVSTTLGVSVSTVRNHLARGMERLRSILEVTSDA